jgi:hypothetical protein
MFLLRRFLALPPRVRRCTAEAVVYLLATRLAFGALPLPQALRLLRITQGGFPLSRVAEAEADEVASAIGRAARHVPFRAACLQQAFAALLMLRRRRLSATVQLGVARDSQGMLRAHAWSRCGEVPVTGADAADGFAAVAVFSA